MAQSPSHKFGQIIGNLLEEILHPILSEFCASRGLYLDTQGPRPGVRTGRKVTWEDKYGNTHDLDFVIEKGGSPDQRGRPVAFIEAAWRRYTKHSRNKVQEIQGAVLPIAEKYEWDSPFLGAAVAGVFTSGSLEQLKSVGFEVLYFPYETILEAFQSVRINVRFDESTPDAEFRDCVDEIEGLDHPTREALKARLVDDNQERIDKFFEDLERLLDRVVDRIIILPLFGTEHAFQSKDDALVFLNDFDENEHDGAFHGYEVNIRFSNGDEVRGTFNSRAHAAEFLDYVAP